MNSVNDILLNNPELISIKYWNINYINENIETIISYLRVNNNFRYNYINKIKMIENSGSILVPSWNTFKRITKLLKDMRIIQHTIRCLDIDNIDLLIETVKNNIKGDINIELSYEEKYLYRMPLDFIFSAIKNKNYTIEAFKYNYKLKNYFNRGINFNKLIYDYIFERRIYDSYSSRLDSVLKNEIKNILLETILEFRKEYLEVIK